MCGILCEQQFFLLHNLMAAIDLMKVQQEKGRAWAQTCLERLQELEEEMGIDETAEWIAYIATAGMPIENERRYNRLVLARTLIMLREEGRHVEAAEIERQFFNELN